MKTGASFKQQVADCVFDYFTQYRPDDHRAQQLCLEMLNDLESIELGQSFLVAPLQQHWLNGDSERVPLDKSYLLFALRIFYSEVTRIIVERDRTEELFNISTLFDTPKETHQRLMKGKLKLVVNNVPKLGNPAPVTDQYQFS